jgi:hypothetical protein
MPLSMIMSMSKQGSKSSLLLDESDDESEDEDYSIRCPPCRGCPLSRTCKVHSLRAFTSYTHTHAPHHLHPT